MYFITCFSNFESEYLDNYRHSDISATPTLALKP